MILTRHAEQRLAQRGIPASAVAAAVLNGTIQEQEDGKTRVEYMGFAAVIGPDGELVTAFETDRLPRATGPKRAARQRRSRSRAFQLENRGGRAHNNKWGGS